MSGDFGVRKTIYHSHKIFYWPCMKGILTKYVNGCVICSICKQPYRKLGLYTPLLVPSHPWESVSMDFIGWFPFLRKCHEFLHIMVDRFSKMCFLMPCKKSTSH